MTARMCVSTRCACERDNPEFERSVELDKTFFWSFAFSQFVHLNSIGSGHCRRSERDFGEKLWRPSNLQISDLQSRHEDLLLRPPASSGPSQPQLVAPQDQFVQSIQSSGACESERGITVRVPVFKAAYWFLRALVIISKFNAINY